MIKKFLFVIIMAVMVGLASMAASTHEFPYLSFLTIDRTVQSIAVNDLTITMGNGTLTASNGNATMTFTLTDLDKMFFSESSGLAQLTADSVEQVEVFDESGKSVGRFANAIGALQALDSGVYVIKGKTFTLKIAVQ
jgi:hypothetical protein